MVSKRAGAEDYAGCKVFMDCVARDDSLYVVNPAIRSIFIAAWINISNSLLGRKIIITEGGLIGGCPEETQAGDGVWILKGGKMPLVLHRSNETRSIPELNLDSALRHTLVGDCVDGIMDGKASERLTANPKDVATF